MGGVWDIHVSLRHFVEQLVCRGRNSCLKSLVGVFWGAMGSPSDEEGEGCMKILYGIVERKKVKSCLGFNGF